MYVVIAYKWDCTNLHNYLIGATQDLDWAKEVAQAERDDRGGKYGVAVYETDCVHPEDRDDRPIKIAHYVPSMLGREEPYSSLRNTSLEMIGLKAFEMYEKNQLVDEPVKRECARLARFMEEENVD
jgi:hypothetical protein